MSEEVQVFWNVKTNKKFSVKQSDINDMWPKDDAAFQKMFPGIPTVSKPYKDPIGDKLADYMITENRPVLLTMYILQKITGTFAPVSIVDNLYTPLIYKYKKELNEILDALGIASADIDYFQRLMNLIFIKLTGGMYTSAGTD